MIDFTKKLLITISFILLASCAGNELLEKNIACNNYRSQIDDKNEKADLIWNENNPHRKLKTSVTEVFYSPKTKSCLYLSKEESFYSNSRYSVIYALRDYFSTKMLTSAFGGDSGTSQTWLEAQQKIEAEMKDYK